MRLGLMQAWPVLRNLTRAAPLAARAASASCRTMKGAWPPGSIETRFMGAAAGAGGKNQGGRGGAGEGELAGGGGVQEGVGDVGRVVGGEEADDAGREAGLV